MKNKLVIFGSGDIAQLAHYYFSNDSLYDVVAFTVDSEYKTVEEFCGLPVIAFSELKAFFSPQDVSVFVALSYSKLNAVRKDKYLAVKAMGYTLASYISSKATVLNQQDIGENCFILEDNTIQPFVKIGNDVVLWSGNHIGHHSTIHDHVYFTSHVVLSGRCEVGAYSFFGVNATIRDGCKIGEGTLVAMGANITRPKTDQWTIWKGNPAVKSEVSSKDINL